MRFTGSTVKVLALASLLLVAPALARAQEAGEQGDEMGAGDMKGGEGADEMTHEGMKGDMAKEHAMEAEHAMAMEKLPLVVKIHADWCPKCRAIAPAWSRVEKELSEEARVVVLDVTDETTLEAARARAEELGLEEFFEANRSRTGLVAVFEPGSSKPAKLLVAEKKFEPYRQAVAAAS